ncbi:MAG: TerC family protein [Burkholderiales bacterium]|jgi:YjbE family integral membrane protein|nr:TerC family protein [Burkholderiales bacterium]
MEIGLNAVFITGVLQIIAIDLLLGGDNAIVIALACRKLSPEQRRKGVFWGVFGAVVARLILIFFALQLLALPYLKIVGSVLLLWIGVKLLLPDHDEHDNIESSSRLLDAIKTIVIADVVMSLDNVIAVAAAAHGHMALAVFGIAVSIPVIVWGSQFVLKLLTRYPVIVYFGGALLGWIGGRMLMSDPALASITEHLPPYSALVAAVVGAVMVVVLGYVIGSKNKRKMNKNP